MIRAGMRDEVQICRQDARNVASRNHGTSKTSRLSSPLLCIWESSGSNLGLGNGCPASYFSRFSSVLSGECQDSTLN